MFWIGVLTGAVVMVVVAGPVVFVRTRTAVARVRAAERRARAAERMAEIGAMTDGLAHEIKNPLSTIGLNAQLLAEGIDELEANDEQRARLTRRIDALRREADRLRDILTDFLRFAGEVRLQLVEADLNQVTEELVDFFAPQAGHHGVRFRSEVAKEKMPVMLDAAHFKQALLNLLLNATQAMEQTSAGSRELIIRTHASEQEGMPVYCVHVIDTGPGMSPEVLERVFTPYYTTKAGGSGLGLPTTKRLIEEHGGTIEVHSEVGRGTDFVITVPRA